MSDQERVWVIACGVLARDIRYLAKSLNLSIQTYYLPGGLHNNPTKLRQMLQEAIDQASAANKWDRIVIGYGVCGLGTVHLQARNIPLILPKVHDCIALFLGGDKAYREQFLKYPGTYYVSAGWLEENKEPPLPKRPYVFMGDSRVYYDDLVSKYGEAHARRTFNFLSTWQGNYQRAAFIDTGHGDNAGTARHARQMAEKYHWQYEALAGNLSLLTKLLTATQPDDEILVVPPGGVTTFNPVDGGLATGSTLDSGLTTDQKWKSRQWIEGPTEQPILSQLRIGLGIDAGGTYTDAVIYDFENGLVLGKNKAPTTRWDFSIGVRQVLSGLDPDLLGQVQLTAVSTTLATNAIVEGEGQKVGLLLMPPEGSFREVDLPHEPKAIISGRLGIDGEIIEPVDEAQVGDIATRMATQLGVKAFAVSGYAGSINPEHELMVKKIIQAKTGCFVSCGHELSGLLNFKTRAHTAVLNARIVPRIGRLVRNIEKVLKTAGISGPIMVVKGDGSLMSSSLAMDRPVETILSGPAASVTGARFLTGVPEALVVDMGGTTTDLAAVDNNTVQICESGAKIGRDQTHVKALKIRTTGLGGDSLVTYHDGTVTIGPRRVTPLAWLGRQVPSLEATFAHLNQRASFLRGSSRQTQIMALTSYEDYLPLSDSEYRILELLRQRPFSIDELTIKTGALHAGALELSSLEERHIIRRCGLTPTDLLHVTGRFTDWDTEAARQMCLLVARLSNMNPEDLVNRVLNRIVEQLSLELIKKQLDDDVDPEKVENSEIGLLLLNHIFGNGSKNYSLDFQLHRPVIGIGAPIGYFLPQAASFLNTTAILPPNGDVANAIGAITSHVIVQKQVAIIPDQRGGYSIKGLAGALCFKNMDEAQNYAVQELSRMVRETARLAGTSATAVQFGLKDKISYTPKGYEVFLERQLTAELSGPPDLLLTDLPKFTTSGHRGT